MVRLIHFRGRRLRLVLYLERVPRLERPRLETPFLRPNLRVIRFRDLQKDTRVRFRTERTERRVPKRRPRNEEKRAIHDQNLDEVLDNRANQR